MTFVFSLFEVTRKLFIPALIRKIHVYQESKECPLSYNFQTTTILVRTLSHDVLFLRVVFKIQ